MLSVLFIFIRCSTDFCYTITIVVGDLLQINYTANGLPTPTVQWFRNGVSVSSVALMSLQYSEVLAHSIAFTCVGANDAGNKTRSMHTNIIVNNHHINN